MTGRTARGSAQARLSRRKLALICRWRSELDHQEAAGRDGAPLDDLLFPETGIEHARHASEWHAHRDHWLARLAETGIAPISVEGF